MKKCAQLSLKYCYKNLFKSLHADFCVECVCEINLKHATHTERLQMAVFCCCFSSWFVCVFSPNTACLSLS